MKSGRSTQRLFVIGTLAACIPAAVVWFQANRPLPNLPLRAETDFKLLDLTYKQEQDVIDEELKKNVSTSTTYVDMRARWQVLQKQMIESGAKSTEAQEVLQSAQNSLSTVRRGMPAPHWPVFAKRGWIKNKPVWIIAAAWPYPPGTSVAPDEPTWKFQIFLIDPKDTGRVTSRGVLS